MPRIARAACFAVAASLGAAGVASAQPPQPAITAPASTQSAKPAGQGVAVLAVGTAREEAFALARAVYAGRLRPTALDEVRARVLAGGAPPANASRELRELAEVRAAVTGDDAATRRLLTGIAQQVGAQALLVVRVERAADLLAAPAEPAPADAGAAADGGAPAEAAAAADAGAGNAAPTSTVVARLFLADPGEFDAARYSPELSGAPHGSTQPSAWKSTVASLEGRFPAPSRVVGPDGTTRPAVTSMKPEEEKSRPFYASGWFWGALAGAALLGGLFYLAAQDSSDDPIHLQMRVPR